MQDTDQFKVRNETNDFVLIEINHNAIFNGNRLGYMPMLEIATHYQYLLDEHGLMPIHMMQGVRSPTTDKQATLLVCRKVKA